MLGWSFPFPLFDGGPVGGCGSLADRWTNAGALLLFDSPAEVVPGIISILELSLDELSVCCSRFKINLMSSPIECSSEVTCRDSWSILAFISSTGRPGPLWKSPRIRNNRIKISVQLELEKFSSIVWVSSVISFEYYFGIVFHLKIVLIDVRRVPTNSIPFLNSIFNSNICLSYVLKNFVKVSSAFICKKFIYIGAM